MGWLDTALSIANSEIGKGIIKAGVTSLTNNNSPAIGGASQPTMGLVSIPGITAGGTIGLGNQQSNSQQMPVWLWPVVGVVALVVVMLAVFKK